MNNSVASIVSVNQTNNTILSTDNKDKKLRLYIQYNSLDQSQYQNQRGGKVIIEITKVVIICN